MTCSVAGIPLALLLFSPAAFCDEPLQISVCDLKNNPALYIHKLVRITGVVSNGMEDFTLQDPACSQWPDPWLVYGGTVSSGTKYCCGVSAARSRPKELVVDEIPIPLVVDGMFGRFDGLIHRPRAGLITKATILARFFAEYQKGPGDKRPWGGYGHFGVHTLLVIQQVVAFESNDRKNK
jgi:hypothetical protein